jgi:hypothetical protein
MVRKIGTTLALLTLVGAVSASASQRRENELLRDRPNDESTTVVTTAPEIDPASAMAGLTLLAGCLVVLRGRKAKKTGQ